VNEDNTNKDSSVPNGTGNETQASSAPRRGRPPKNAKPAAEPEAITKLLPPNTPNFNAYIRYLGAVAAAADKKGRQDDAMLDPNEKALLEIVALRWAHGAPMTVRQAIALAYLGSPATLHKRLMRLRKRKYLQLQSVSGDKRVKQLVPGTLGLEFIEDNGRLILSTRHAVKRADKASEESAQG
jgi:hypothetical protein